MTTKETKNTTSEFKSLSPPSLLTRVINSFIKGKISGNIAFVVSLLVILIVPDLRALSVRQKVHPTSVPAAGAMFGHAEQITRECDYKHQKMKTTQIV